MVLDPVLEWFRLPGDVLIVGGVLPILYLC
jgi:hypothetical protein